METLTPEDLQVLVGIVRKLEIQAWSLDMGGSHAAKIRHGVRLTPTEWDVISKIDYPEGIN